MRAAKYLWLAVPILAACSDVTTPSAPSRGPAFTTSGTANLIVRGFTTDAYFHRYATVPGYFVTGTYEFVWNKQTGELVTVKVDRMGSNQYVSMNGGETYAMGTVDGVQQYLGSVSGDMEGEIKIFDVPAGGFVTLEAHPNDGCRFLFWEDSVGNKIYGNPLTVYPTTSLITREAWYQCGTVPRLD